MPSVQNFIAQGKQPTIYNYRFTEDPLKISMGEPISCFSEVRALIFDLDGTLIDSKLDLALAVNAVLAEWGRGPLPHEPNFGYIGQGAPNLIARALGDGPPKTNAAGVSNSFFSIIPSTN